jgi:tetratricopeptide (TPR) repeat protein
MATVKQETSLLIFLLLLTFLLHLGSLPKEFTNWDDGVYITRNPWIQSLNLNNLRHLATEPVVANYLPVTLFSYALDCQLWGLDANKFHLHNIALHLICVLLVFFILKQMQVGQPVLWLATALFALHPSNVESIGWASERKNLLASMFFLASFFQYLKYSKTHHHRCYLFSILFFLLSLLSKASAVMTPIIFLAYDFFKDSKGHRDLRLYDKIPFLAMSEIMGFWTIHGAQVDNAYRSYHQEGVFFSLLSIPKLLTDYGQILLWPFNLNPTYVEIESGSWHDFSFWVTAVMVLAGLALLYWKMRKGFFWVAFFLLFMAPVLNLIPLPIRMANRYLYVPQIGFWIVLISILGIVSQWLRPWKGVRVLAIVLATIWIISISFETWRASAIWRNSETLWTAALERGFSNATAHYNLGLHYLDRGKINQAGLHFVLATEISPQYADAYNALGLYFSRKNRNDLAVQSFQKALEINPDLDQAVNNLGKVMIEQGQNQKALFLFVRATYLNPNNLDAYGNLLTFYLRAGNWPMARETAEIMVQRFPWESKGYLGLAQAAEKMGMVSQAILAWEQYLQSARLEEPIRAQIKARIQLLKKHL